MVQPEENYLSNMEDNKLNDDGRQYLSMLQSIIDRMGNNSANCKNLLFTIIAAFLALQVGNGELGKYLWFLTLPIILFLCLDVKYLKLEKEYRALEKEYIDNPEGSSLLYEFDTTKIPGYKASFYWKESLLSWSTIWFYLACLIIVLFMWGVTTDWFQTIMDYFKPACNCTYYE